MPETPGHTDVSASRLSATATWILENLPVPPVPATSRSSTLSPDIARCHYTVTVKDQNMAPQGTSKNRNFETPALPTSSNGRYQEVRMSSSNHQVPEDSHPTSVFSPSLNRNDNCPNKRKMASMTEGPVSLHVPCDQYPVEPPSKAQDRRAAPKPPSRMQDRNAASKSSLPWVCCQCMGRGVGGITRHQGCPHEGCDDCLKEQRPYSMTMPTNLTVRHLMTFYS